MFSKKEGKEATCSCWRKSNLILYKFIYFRRKLLHPGNLKNYLDKVYECEGETA